MRHFLFGFSDIHEKGSCVQAILCLDPHMEGWIGIPHGGIGMGAIMDLAMRLDNDPGDGGSRYPLSVDFRMGGSPVRIGDRVRVKVTSKAGGAAGVIVAGEDAPPYMSASMAYGNDDPARRDLFASYLPAGFSAIENRLLPLPYYRNCFVCGVSRRHPGLERCFYSVNDGPSERIILSTVGFDARDRGNVYLFQRNQILHPMALLALLDETMGWAGFMASGSGGVTVRIAYTFYRDIQVGEKMVVFGRGERVRGRAASRLLFWASGGVAVVNDAGGFEVVVAASGQFLGVSDLTAQMKAELIPSELAARVFATAGP